MVDVKIDSERNVELKLTSAEAVEVIKGLFGDSPQKKEMPAPIVLDKPKRKYTKRAKQEKQYSNRGKIIIKRAQLAQSIFKKGDITWSDALKEANKIMFPDRHPPTNPVDVTPAPEPKVDPKTAQTREAVIEIAKSLNIPIMHEKNDEE